MGEIQLAGYKMEYSVLNLELLEKEPVKYHVGLFYVILEEARKGFYFSKINKATKKGTAIKYKVIQS